MGYFLMFLAALFLALFMLPSMFESFFYIVFFHLTRYRLWACALDFIGCTKKCQRVSDSNCQLCNESWQMVNF
jgi:hypothetical protein